MTCAQCEEMAEELHSLRRELAVERAGDRVAKLVRGLRLSPAEAELVAALYGVNGRCLSMAHLDEIMPRISAGEDRDFKHVQVRICRIRKVMGAAAIENIWGRGYVLTEIGRLLVEETLERRMAA